MSEQLALGLTALAIVALYVGANFWLARRLATWLTDRTGPRDEAPVIDAETGIAIDPDDVIVNREEVDDGTGHRTWRSVSRWEQRYRYWWLFLALPLFGYLNYHFFDEISAGLEASFAWLGGHIVDFFYRG